MPTAVAAPALRLSTWTRRAPLPVGQQHRHVAAILLVGGAVLVHEIALLELDGEDDVGGRGEREDEVRQRHRRRHPEREQEAEIQRCRTNR